MISVVQFCQAQRKKKAGLRAYRPPGGEPSVGRWRINGHGASIVIWTAEEWERLTERPADAQYFACGVWCAPRID